MTAKSTSALIAEIAALMPDNTVGTITPAIIRTVLTDIVNSYPNAADTPPIALAGPLTVPTLNLTTLPTSLPGTAGVLWNNGGMLSIS